MYFFGLDMSWGTLWQKAEEVLTIHPSSTNIPEKISDHQPCNYHFVLFSPSHKVHMHEHALPQEILQISFEK